MNIGSAIKKASIDLKESNIKTAVLDSEILMSKILKKDRKFLILNSKENLNEIDYNGFRKLVSKRLNKEPVAYLTGFKSFWKYDFKVDKNVLIPRPDSELIVEQVLKIYKNKNYINILEIGVGSGCIILSILKEKSSFIGRGIDISKGCLKICKANAEKLKVEKRLKLFKSNVDNFKTGKYDLIISNPPYIKQLDFKNLDKEVIKYEPRIALYGGLDGLTEISKIVKKSSELIKLHGKLILEIAHDQKNEVKKILTSNGFYIHKVVKDLAKNDRCIISSKL